MNVRKNKAVFLFMLLCSGCFNDYGSVVEIKEGSTYIQIERPIQADDGVVSVDLRVINNTKFNLFTESRYFCGITSGATQVGMNVEALTNGVYESLPGHGFIFGDPVVGPPLKQWKIKAGESKVCTVTLDDKYSMEGKKKIRVSFSRDVLFGIDGTNDTVKLPSNLIEFELKKPVRFKNNPYRR